MADRENPSTPNRQPFWTTLPGILSGIAAIIVAVGGLLVVLNRGGPGMENGKNQELGEPDVTPALALGEVNSSHPDFVEIQNNLQSTIGVGGYEIREGDPGKEATNRFTLPEGTQIEKGGKLKVWFFSRKKAERRRQAEQYRSRGHIVCDLFGISSGEIVELRDPNGKLLDRKVAR